MYTLRLLLLPTLYVPLVLSLSACQAPEAALPRGLSAEAEIGKALFFDAGLSNPAGQSCASCHSPAHGFSDPDSQYPVSQGANPQLFGNRNTPTAAYAAFSPAFHFDAGEGLYIGGQFLDGRAATPEQQALQPLLNPLEMNNSGLAEVVEKVRSAPYAEQIRHLYGEQSLDDIEQAQGLLARAITAYERSREVAPFSSKYDLYLAGRTQLSDAEMRGLRVFEDAKKGNCAACHPNARSEQGQAPLFTDHSYDNLGVPALARHPFYAMPTHYNPLGKNYVDHGLGGVLRLAEEDGKFKVPTLRNIALTAPYMHNGVFTSLDEVVEFYNSRDTDKRWGRPEVAANVNRDELGDLRLSTQERADLVAFLKTLSDGYQTW